MSFCRIWNQDAFLGAHKKRKYFEGWYFKLIDQQRNTVLAVIPGVSIEKSREDAHAFIQVIDGIKGVTAYFRFPFDDFKSEKNAFRLRIGENEFSDRGIRLCLNQGNMKISGELFFTELVKYPKSFFSPGIMGPFSFIPYMECYHGIVNMSHKINGFLNIDGAVRDMTGGEGYIEKDWGSSFPDTWIWVQANHFKTPGTSFMFSVARIPWLGRSFTGLICFLQTKNGFYKFATYNGSRLQAVKTGDGKLEAAVCNGKYSLEFSAVYSKGGILKAPKNGLMSRKIEESIDADVSVHLARKHGGTVFKDTSHWGGIEIAGSLEGIL
ncbi:MAG: tocopherol cyclase family protein [Christensenellales bacterium]